MTNPAEASPSHPRWLRVAARPATTVALIATATLLRLAYILWLCPYTLAEDEAHYWEWARRLDWSYYTKGPGIAWIIAGSEKLFASLGLPDTEAAIRAPAALFAAITAGAVASLARDITRDQRAAFVAAALVLITPLIEIASSVLTIDLPLVAFWALGAWAGWRAIEGRSRWAWISLGGAIGAGFLVKYTILFLPAGLALYALLRRGRISPAPRWQPWAASGTLVALLGTLPVVIWNAHHDWPTVRHLLGHLGVAGGDMPVTQGGDAWHYSPLWTIKYVLLQAAIMLPTSVLMIGGVVLALRWRHLEPAQWPGHLFLIAVGVPVLFFYFLVSLVADVEANWPVAGYITLFALAAWCVLARCVPGSAAPSPVPTPARFAWRSTILIGVLTGVLVLRLDWLAISFPARAIERVARGMGVLKPGRTLIPLGRFMRADVMAADTARLGAGLLAETGREPFYVANVYGRASQLAYYLPGRPAVYCSSPFTGGRVTQYDYWPDTSLADPALLGRPAVLVGGKIEEWTPAFDRVREAGQLAGETKKDRLTFLGFGYRGFPVSPRSTSP